jgi:zinc/manganese transport system substrate-binding protein
VGRTGITLVLAAILLGACSSGTPGTPADGPAGTIAVLGTENFYADVLAQVGGTRVTATSLLNDPAADPHSFDASPRAAKLVADAKLVIVNGLGYDDFMQKLLGASTKPDRVVIDVQQLLGLKDRANAHIWYEPGTMPKVAESAAAALAKIDPANAAYYDAQKAKYLGTLKPLTDKVAVLKSRYEGAPIAFTEAVAEYLTDAIGLKLLTPEGFMRAIEQGIDPAPADVAAERDLLTGRKVKTLLYNSQVTSPLTSEIRALAEKSGVPVVGVAETIPPAYRTFQDWQLAQLDALEKALSN